MAELLVLFAHLLAVCVALGVIVASDIQLLARMTGSDVMLPPPKRLERRLIGGSLVVLYVTGVALIGQKLQTNPAYLQNPKFQAKLILVGVLTLNAFVLHGLVFPVLRRAPVLAEWCNRTLWKLALSVGLSNSLWLYCAFLGIARPWNNTRPLWFVLGVAPVLWLGLTLAIRFLLLVASRNAPQAQPDWLDHTKTMVGDVTRALGAPQARSANPPPSRARPSAPPSRALPSEPPQQTG